jgi:hypothetical protein
MRDSQNAGIARHHRALYAGRLSAARVCPIADSVMVGGFVCHGWVQLQWF